jgi:predicted membrane protein
VIPTLIVAGLIVGRWWAAAVAAVVWPIVLAFTLPDGRELDVLLGGALLAIANTLLGVAVHKAIAWPWRHAHASGR